MYEGAEGRSWKDKVNAMRRAQYAVDPEKFRAQKRAAYVARKERGTVANGGGDDIIKSHRKLRNADLPNGLPIKSTPNSISDKIDDDGKVLQRRVYGSDGLAAIDYDTSNHGRPKDHPTGAHKHIFNHKLRNPHGKPLPLTEKELRDNQDIIQRGVNYFDEE